MIRGGPVIYVSKKLNHVGLNAFHNEYMAMCETGKHVVWLRQLLGELCMRHMISEPTLVYGDNYSALNLSVEDFVSTGNQYVYLPYHFNKELGKLGYCKFVKKSSKCNIADLFTKSVVKKTIDDLLPYIYGEQAITEDVLEDVV